MLLFMENGSIKGEFNLQIERKKNVGRLQADKLLFRKYASNNKEINMKHFCFTYDGNFHFYENKVEEENVSFKFIDKESFLKALLASMKTYLLNNHIEFSDIKLINN